MVIFRKKLSSERVHAPNALSDSLSTPSEVEGPSAPTAPSYLELADNAGGPQGGTVILDKAAKAKAIPRVRKRGHARPLAVTVDLHQPARLRAGHLMNLFAVSHASLYKRLRDGRLPKPDGYDGRRPFWNSATILALLEK